jgi:hypothetical protein
MRKYLALRNAPFFVVVAIVSAVFLGGAAHAITDTVFRYSHVKTGHFSLSPLAFAPSDFNHANRYAIIYGPPGMRPIGGQNACFNAGVNLPDGARMTNFAVSHTTDIANGVTVFLTRHTIRDGSVDLIIQEELGDTLGARRLTRLLINGMARVDNQRYAYGVGICLNSPNTAYFGGRIAYTYSKAGD